MTTDVETYRKLLESALAVAIIDRRELGIDEASMTLYIYYTWEINGLCVALRLLGGYGDTAFDLAWATSPDRPKEDWMKVLEDSYVS